MAGQLYGPACQYGSMEPARAAHCGHWAQGTHAHWDNLTNIGIVGYWINGVVASAGLILRSCPTIPSGGWARWLVLVHSVQVCGPSVGVRGRYSPGWAGLGWAGLGWPGRGTGSGVYIHCRSLFRLHLHRLPAPPTTNHHWRQSCLNKTRIS